MSVWTVVCLFVAGLIPLYAFCYLLYVLIGLPLRRQERARFFLDLIETGLSQGGPLEQTILSISRSRDYSLGPRFHLLAAYLEAGWALGEALRKVGGLLPPQMIQMLIAGEEIGDPRKVLPACRTLLRDGSAHVQSAYNYVVVLAFVLIPIVPALLWLLSIFVFPKFETIFADLLEGASLPDLPFQAAALLSQVQLLLALVFYLGAIFYVGGPRFWEWLKAGLSIPRLDAVPLWVPWRRRRLQRDFAAMLGVLLDSGVPEERAVKLAAASTANEALAKSADKVMEQLRSGLALPDAIAQLDSDEEFGWRLRNAVHSGKDFFAALSGWLEALEARAYQQQQAFGQGVTTMLVLYNGAMVGLFAWFVFHAITLVIEEGVLW